MGKSDKVDIESSVLDCLKQHKDMGLTITDLVGKTGVAVSRMRIALARLEGAEKVNLRKIGMAKVYTLK